MKKHFKNKKNVFKNKISSKNKMLHKKKSQIILLNYKRNITKKFLGKKSINIDKINILSIFIIFILFIFVSEEKNIIKLLFLSEITITIKGIGDQKIIAHDPIECDGPNSNNTPDHILINGILQNYSGKMAYNLTKEINNVTLQWDNPLINCNTMFFNLKNIIKVDLSKFDSSQVTDIGCMFEQCNSLEYIDFTNFKTSTVTYMGWMFNYCISLKSINLNNFDTSKVTDMHNMFSNCHSLISLNINNFNLDNLKHYSNMFFNINSNLIYCIKNKNSSIFNELLSTTSNLNCSDICFTNLQHKLVINQSKCIDNCINNLEYPFEYNNICYNNCPNGTSPDDNNVCKDIFICKNNYNFNYNKTECIDYVPQGYYINDSVLKTIDKCNIKCNNCSLESIQNNDLCISCNNNQNYYQKYNDILNINNFINCYNHLEGFFLFNNTFYECYQTCKDCYGFGDENNNNCSSCNLNYIFKTDYENDSNCYEICIYYYYFDSNKKHKCTENRACPDKYNKLINEKKKCVNNCSNDNLYKYEYNNICYEKCPNGTNISSYNKYICEKIQIKNVTTEIKKEVMQNCNIEDFFNAQCNIEISNSEGVDEIISNIKNLIKNGGLDSLLLNVTQNKQDLVNQENNIIYQITTSDNQKTNKYSNISIIKLEECETKLRKNYNLDENIPLLIFKIDIYEEGILTPEVVYEVYNSKTKETLNLTICSDKKISILLPISIEDDDIIKYNASSDYYNDICYTFTTDNKTDITLSDRKKEYIKNNMSLCKTNCEYNGYDNENKKAECECEIKINIPLISEIYINKKDLLSNFEDINNIINLEIMKCYKVIFSKEGLKKNIGNYTILSIILINIILFIVFIIKGKKQLYNLIKKIIPLKQNNINKHKDKENTSKIKKIKGKKDKKKNKNKKIKKHKIKIKNSIINIINVNKSNNKNNKDKKAKIKKNQDNKNSKKKKKRKIMKKI